MPLHIDGAHVEGDEQPIQVCPNFAISPGAHRIVKGDSGPREIAVPFYPCQRMSLDVDLDDSTDLTGCELCAYSVPAVGQQEDVLLYDDTTRRCCSDADATFEEDAPCFPKLPVSVVNADESTSEDY